MRWLACIKGYASAKPEQREALREMLFLFDRPLLNENGDSEELIRAMRWLPRRPVLVILDTMARTFSGEENSATDVGDYVRAVDDLRQAFGCAVLVLHHQPLKDKRPRGSTALAGAADVIMSIESERGPAPAILRCLNSRGSGAFDDIYLEFTVERVGTDAWGYDITSLQVLCGEPGAVTSRLQTSNAADKILKALADWSGPSGPCSRELQEASSMRGGTFTRITKDLMEAGRVAKAGQGRKTIWSLPSQ